jgi:glycosyltransferase involved in cell wall biosynthesis
VFVVVGDGEDKTRLEKIAQGLPVVFLGRLSRKQTIGFLKNTNIYIHSSYPGGGLSTSLLEAMYCRCAVIATPHEGANEIVEDQKNGLLLKSEESFESAIIKMLNKDLRATLADAAKESVTQRFSWPHSIQQYLTYFKQL